MALHVCAGDQYLRFQSYGAQPGKRLGVVTRTGHVDPDRVGSPARVLGDDMGPVPTSMPTRSSPGAPLVYRWGQCPHSVGHIDVNPTAPSDWLHHWKHSPEPVGKFQLKKLSAAGVTPVTKVVHIAEKAEPLQTPPYRLSRNEGHLRHG